MLKQQQGSFGKTLFYSFAYGFAGFVLVIRHIFLDGAYDHDALCICLLTPIGAFLGFIGASFVHELAHFFVARLLGGFVRKIQISSGSLLGSFRILGTRCDVHESLRSGAVFYFLTSAENARKKLAAITAAGPLASITLVTFLVAMLIIVHPLANQPFSLWYYVFPATCGIHFALHRISAGNTYSIPAPV